MANTEQVDKTIASKPTDSQLIENCSKRLDKINAVLKDCVIILLPVELRDFFDTLNFPKTEQEVFLRYVFNTSIRIEQILGDFILYYRDHAFLRDAKVQEILVDYARQADQAWLEIHPNDSEKHHYETRTKRMLKALPQG